MKGATSALLGVKVLSVSTTATHTWSVKANRQYSYDIQIKLLLLCGCSGLFFSSDDHTPRPCSREPHGFHCKSPSRYPKYSAEKRIRVKHLKDSIPLIDARRSVMSEMARNTDSTFWWLPHSQASSSRAFFSTWLADFSASSRFIGWSLTCGSHFSWQTFSFVPCPLIVSNVWIETANCWRIFWFLLDHCDLH